MCKAVKVHSDCVLSQDRYDDDLHRVLDTIRCLKISNVTIMAIIAVSCVKLNSMIIMLFGDIFLSRHRIQVDGWPLFSANEN